MNEQKRNLLPMAAMLVTIVLWASAFVAIRHLAGEFSAGGLALGRLLVASLLLLPFVLVQKGKFPPRRLWPRLLVCGLLWFGLYNVALNQAESLVDAGTAAMLVNIGPILIAILAGFFLGEGFPKPLLIGSMIAFGGVIVIGLSTANLANASFWGVALCVVAAIAYAIGVVAQKPLLAEASGLNVTWLACLIGAAACLPFTPSLINDLQHASLSSIGWMVYLGAMPTALGFITWAYALARTSAGRLGNSTYLVPPTAILMAWLVLGETPAWGALVGGVICLVGVYVARRRVSS